MFDDWRRKRALRRAVKKANLAFQREYEAGERRLSRLIELRREQDTRENLLLQFESDSLVDKAERRYGIAIPRTDGWWCDDSASGLPPEDVSYYLNHFGMVNVRNLIREKRRQNFEWWYTKVILPTVQALVPILSLLVALITVWRK
jgi:hypothetical protein